MIRIGLGVDLHFIGHGHDIGNDGEGNGFFHKRSTGGAVINQASVIGNNQGSRIEQACGLHDLQDAVQGSAGGEHQLMTGLCQAVQGFLHDRRNRTVT